MSGYIVKRPDGVDRFPSDKIKHLIRSNTFSKEHCNDRTDHRE